MIIRAGIDWIIPLVFIVIAVLQVLGKSKKIASGKEPPPPKIGGEWDDLLEALGQKTKKEETPVAPPPVIRKASKPVVKKAPPKIVKLEPVPDEFNIRHTVEMPSEEADTRKKQAAQFVSKTILEEPVKIVSKRKRSILATLSNRHSIRDAILINEILSPPVALRN